jgi:hypothetical protein
MEFKDQLRVQELISYGVAIWFGSHSLYERFG